MSFVARTRSRTRPPIAGFLAALVVLVASAPAQQIQRVSVDSSGGEGNARSVSSVISADGRTSAFSSYATNLVVGDTNGFRDVFVHDTTTLSTVRVSVASTGLQANNASYSPSLSGNGRFIAFTSTASNLVPGDTNGVADVFVHDRDPDGNGIFDEGNGVTVRASVDSFGLEGNGASRVAYSHTISNDGRLVVFTSEASDLVTGDVNGVTDIFVRDLINGTTRRVSVDSAGAETNRASTLATISGNGNVVAFQSDATNLVPGDTNGVTDVFTHDLMSGLTTRASVDTNGLQFSRACTVPALSSDGGVIAFRKANTSGSATVFDICVRDNAMSSTQQLTGSSYSYSQWWSHDEYWSWATAPSFAALSADGSRVAYIVSGGSSYAYSGWPTSSFSAGVTASLVVYDRPSNTTLVVATTTSGNFSNQSAAFSWVPFFAPAMSDDGRQVAVESDVSNLVAGDTNGARDAFVCDLSNGLAIGWNYCTAQPNSTGQSASISAQGFASVSAQTLSLEATNLPPGVNGLFFYGGMESSAPFGDGTICVGGWVQRLPVVTANAAGVMTQANVFAVPASVFPILAGATYYFQAVHRDPAAMQAGFNLTDGLMISFVP